MTGRQEVWAKHEMINCIRDDIFKNVQSVFLSVFRWTLDPTANAGAAVTAATIQRFLSLSYVENKFMDFIFTKRVAPHA